MLFILDSKQRTVGILSNDVPKACPYYNDLHTEAIADNLSTFEFEIPSDHPTTSLVEVEGCIIYTDLDHKKHLFVVKEVFDSHVDTLTKKVFCENVAVGDLLGNIVRPVSLSSKTLQQSLSVVLNNTGWEIGELAYAGVRDINIEDHITSLEALHMVVDAFGGEMDYEVIFDGSTVSRKLINVVLRRGSDTGKIFEYNKDLTGVERTEDTRNLVTALIGVGKGDTDGASLTFADYKAPANESYVKVDDYIYDKEAFQRYHKNGKHIFGVFKDDKATNVVELYEDTLEKLKELSKPKLTFNCTLVTLERITGLSHKSVRIGDTITIQDWTFNPALILSARIMEVKRSKSDPSQDAVVLGDYVPIQITRSDVLAKLQNIVFKSEQQWNESAKKSQEALDKVNVVEGHVSDALTQIEALEGDVSTSLSNANFALETANTVDGKASSALSTANTAMEKANGVEGTASTALETANTAKSTAESAQQTGLELSETIGEVNDRTSSVNMVDTIITSEDFQAIVNNKANTADLEGMVTGDELATVNDSIIKYVNGKIEGSGGVNEAINVMASELKQTKEAFSATFQSAGGVNLIKNSIGYADRAFWLISGTVNAVQDAELEQLGYGSGFTSDKGGYLEQTVNTAKENTFTVSFWIKKIADTGVQGETGVEIWENGVKKAFIGKATGKLTNGYEYARYTFNTTLSETKIRVVFGTGATGMITGLMLNVGENALQWSHHSSEIYNSVVQMDLNGLSVIGTNGNKTVMNQSEFAGYNSEGDKIFALNGSTTEVEKVDVNSEISMQQLKIVPITSSSNNGWAFIKSS